MRQQQLALEIVGEQLVSLAVIVSAQHWLRLSVSPARHRFRISLKQPLPFFSPVVLIIAVVVIACAGHCDFIKIRIAQNCPGRSESPA